MSEPEPTEPGTDVRSPQAPYVIVADDVLERIALGPPAQSDIDAGRTFYDGLGRPISQTDGSWTVDSDESADAAIRAAFKNALDAFKGEIDDLVAQLDAAEPPTARKLIS